MGGCGRSFFSFFRRPPAPRALTLPPTLPPSLSSGKLAGLDKKLSRSLDAEVALGSSPLELSMSPLGPLAEPSR